MLSKAGGTLCKWLEKVPFCQCETPTAQVSSHPISPAQNRAAMHRYLLVCTRGSIDSDSILAMDDTTSFQDSLPEVSVNFDSNLETIFCEAVYLRKLGVETPAPLRPFLEQGGVHSARVNLEQCLQVYKMLRCELPLVEQALFLEKVPLVQRLLRRGCSEVMWSSLGMGDFVNEARCLLVQELGPAMTTVSSNHRRSLEVDESLAFVVVGGMTRLMSGC